MIFPYLYALVSVLNTLMKFKYLLVKETHFFDLIYWVCQVKTGYKKITEEQYKFPLF